MQHKTNPLPFEKRSYQLLIVGVLVILLGLTLITRDQKVLGFGVLGLTIGYITVVIGFIIELFVTMYVGKQKR